MTVYAAQDIYSSFSGDIQVSSNGDVKLGNSYESHESAINFLIRTDKGEYRPDKRVGCDLGSFVGDHMLDTVFASMEDTILENISKFVLDRTDFNVHVMPLDLNEAGVFLVLGGSYMDNDGNLLDIQPKVLTYAHPFFEGEPRFVHSS